MPDVYSRFTSEALYTMRRAREMIDDDQSRQMFPEHLLLAMLELNRSDGARILTNLGVNLRKFKQELIAEKPTWLTEGKEADSGSVTSYMSRSVREVIDAATLEAAHDQVFSVTTRHLLIGLLATSKGAAQRILNGMGVTLDATRAQEIKSSEQSGDKPDQVITGNPFRISPIFLAIVALTVGAGYATYQNLVDNGIFVFLFVMGGWLISLALHEFGHALVAYYAGDRSVASKGYLTLNPLKYTHWLLSIALPLLFVVMGGIGLPGGAVYINRGAIRDERLNSLVSAAGPIATLLCAILLAIPFIFGLIPFESLFVHTQFWSAVAMLLLLEITAFFLNLIPMPGLDGYGILEPFLSDQVRMAMQPVRQYGFIILFFVLFRIDPIANLFWDGVWGMLNLLRVDGWLVGQGYDLFRFWMG